MLRVPSSAFVLAQILGPESVGVLKVNVPLQVVFPDKLLPTHFAIVVQLLSVPLHVSVQVSPQHECFATFVAFDVMVGPMRLHMPVEDALGEVDVLAEAACEDLHVSPNL